MAKRQSKPQALMYSTELMFAASAAADRINDGQYIKVKYYSYDTADSDNIPNEIEKIENKLLMMNFLADQHKLTQEDFIKGQAIRDFFKAFTFEILKGKRLNEFQTKALELASADEISDREIATIASLPFVYFKEMKKKSLENRIKECAPRYVADIGTKVNFSMEVLKASYSTTYNCYFISGITEDNLSVFFATSNWTTDIFQGNTISVAGKVKAHRDNWVSQLSYVKFNKI